MSRKTENDRTWMRKYDDLSLTYELVRGLVYEMDQLDLYYHEPGDDVARVSNLIAAAMRIIETSKEG